MATTQSISHLIHLCIIPSLYLFGTYFQGGSSRRGLKKAGTNQEADVDTPRRLCIQNYSSTTTGKNGKGKGKGGRRERDLKSSSGKGKVSIQYCNMCAMFGLW